MKKSTHLCIPSLNRRHCLVGILALHFCVIVWTAHLYHASVQDNAAVWSHEPPPPKPGMAACLMVRDDNDLLWEWLAYHYQVLPLRLVVVAADYNSTQDPLDVLKRWHGILQYKVWNSTQFMHRFGDIPVPESDENHHYIHRQRAFITTCAEYMVQHNQTWVSFVDTDEFIAMNRIVAENNDTTTAIPDGITTATENDNTTTIRLKQRQSLPPLGRRGTVMDALQRASAIQPLQPCHVMPRLLYSSLENVTCNNSVSTRQFINSQGFSLNHTVTVRYVQHAEKGAFYPSKWGKVLVDLSRISNLNIKPKNSHRPFPECPTPWVEFDTSLLRVNHYLGSWERYNARKDARRSKQAFEERAYFQNGIGCSERMDEWFMRFVKRFGVKKAKYLLGVDVPKSF